MLLRPAALAMPPDIRRGFVGGDTALLGAEPGCVPQRIMPSSAAHLGFDRFPAAASCGRYAMVSIGQDQTPRSLEDDDGRKIIEHLRVPRYSLGIEVRLGIYPRVRQEIGYPQSRHGVHNRRRFEGPQARLS